jgi:hypothetical protein
MRNFTYIIGSADDFESVQDLVQVYRVDPRGARGRRNMSIYPVSLSEGTTAAGYHSLEEIATILARGEAMTDGWCLDDTVSALLEGEYPSEGRLVQGMTNG